MFAATVEMLVIPDAKLVAVNINGPPKEPVVIFCKVRVGVLGVFVKVQTIFANTFRLTTGIVMVLPASVPKLAGLPDVPALVSVHVPLTKLKLAFPPSVRVTGLTMLVTEMLVGATGAATPAEVVVMLAGAPARFVAVKVKGPLAMPVVIF